MKARKWIAASVMASVALPVGQEAYGQLALEEIVVTARKRDESIYEIPVSVSALSSDMMDQAGIDNAQDLSHYVPGIDFRQVDFGGRGNPNLRFRGMIQQIITPSTQIGALFWDGSYIGAGGGFLPLGDMERVEVIKGPQTAYFGRNTFAGAVNYIPKLPGDEWEGDISVAWSPTDADEYNINGGIGGPIGSRMGLRVWAGYDRDGGDFEFGDGEPFAQFRDSSVSGTLTYDATEDIRFKFTGYYTRATDTTTGASVAATVPAGSCGIIYRGESVNLITGVKTPFESDLSQLTLDNFCGQLPDGTNLVTPATRFPGVGDLFPNIQASVDNLSNLNPFSEKYGFIRKPQGSLGGWHQTMRLQLSGEYDVADHTVAWLASRAKTGTTTRVDFFFGIPFLPGFLLPRPDAIFGIGTERYVREFYYEGRITSPQDQRFRYLLGVSDYNQHFREFPDARRGDEIDRQRSSTFSIFGSFDYDVTDDLTLSVEGRYTDEDFIAIEFGDPSLPATDPAFVSDARNSFTAFIPRVILSYTPMDGATTYASWSQSKLLGLASQAAFIASVSPETLSPQEAAALGDFTSDQKNTQYEVGWKQQFENWNFTLAAFFIEWKNQPVPTVIFTPDGGTASLRADGDSEYSGFDFEFNGQLTDWLTLSGSIGYNNGVMTNYSNFGSNESRGLNAPGPVVSDGNPVRNNPEWTGSLSPVITGMWMDRAWFIRGDYLYTGKHFTDYSGYNTNGARKQVNVRAGIDMLDGVLLEVYGTNIFNDKTLPTTSGTTTAAGARKIFTGIYQALEYGVRLSASF